MKPSSESSGESPHREHRQAPPGSTDAMREKPDHGEETYRGSGRLDGKVALITGADSGIGRAVAIAFAREGTDVVIAYLSEHRDAEETTKWVREAGRKAVAVAGDVADEGHCNKLVAQTMEAFGHLDILVNNAAMQRTYKTIEDSGRRMGSHLQDKRLFPVLSVQGGCPGHAVR
jgi:hypothetical protein